MEPQYKKLRVLIVCLSVLLAVSVLALTGTLLYIHFKSAEPTTVKLSGNIITPESESSTDMAAGESGNITFSVPSDFPVTSERVTEYASSKSTAVSSEDAAEAEVISLHNKKPEDNTPFNETNMFPGDAITKYYCVKVSHKGDITVRYHAAVRSGYEKLAEVLKVRISLLGSDSKEILYDGLMSDMPKSLNHKLYASKSTENELYYEITAYLDTSVGNGYMNKELIADFSWWVEETSNLDLPSTGITENVYIWGVLASASLLVLILLLVKRRKETAEDAH